MPASQGKNNRTGRDVLAFMQQHPGEVMHYIDIATALHLRSEQVGAALTRLHSVHPECGIRRTTSGHYLYTSASVGAARVEKTKKEGPALYEEVGTTRDGSVVVRDEKGQLWKLSDAI